MSAPCRYPDFSARWWHCCRLAAPVLAVFFVGCQLPTAAAAAPLTCTSFKAQLSQGAGDLHVDFRRSLVVTRGNAGDSADYYDLTTDVDIDGTLQCKADKFLRFEAKIGVPADARLADQYVHLESAALNAALGWTPAKSSPTLLSMSKDAAEYLRASIQRGDVYVSGKTEEHEPGSIDLGLLWTPTDRTFIIVSG